MLFTPILVFVQNLHVDVVPLKLVLMSLLGFGMRRRSCLELLFCRFFIYFAFCIAFGSNPNPGPCQHAHRRGSENRDEGDESDANSLPWEHQSRYVAGRWPESLGRDHGEPPCRVQRLKCKQFWVQQHERHKFARSARTTEVSTTAASSATAAKITPTDCTPASNVSTPSSSTRAPPSDAPAFWTAVAPLPSAQPASAIGVH